MDKNIRELTRFSKLRKDTGVFTPYVTSQLLKKSVTYEHVGMMAYACAIGEFKNPTLFTADDHAFKRAAERFGVCYAAVILAQIMEAIERCEEMGDLLLQIEDEIYERGDTTGTVALWIEEPDIFCYLILRDGAVHVATVVTNKPTYYVNTGTDAICWIKKDNSLVEGIQQIYKCLPSDGRKFKK